MRCSPQITLGPCRRAQHGDRRIPADRQPCAAGLLGPASNRTWLAHVGKLCGSRSHVPLQVCRTYNFGQVGASQGQFYRRFLKPIRLNEEDIDWMQQDLTYLDPVVYEQKLNATLASARYAEVGLKGLHPAP